MSRLHYDQSISVPEELRSEYTQLSKTRAPRLEIAFICAVLGLFFVPLILNLYSMFMLLTVNRKQMHNDHLKRYIFTWLLNIGALILHTMLLLDLFD